MRLLLDTCAVIDLLTDPENLGQGAMDLVRDPSNLLYASFETMRELIVHFNNKKLLSKQWQSAQDMIDYVENDLDIEFLPLRSRVGYRISAKFKYI